MSYTRGGNPTRRVTYWCAKYYSPAIVQSSLISNLIPVTDSNKRNNLHLAVGAQSASSGMKVKHFKCGQRKMVCYTHFLHVLRREGHPGNLATMVRLGEKKIKARILHQRRGGTQIKGTSQTVLGDLPEDCEKLQLTPRSFTSLHLKGLGS